MRMQLPGRAAALAATSCALVDSPGVRSGWLARMTKRSVDCRGRAAQLFLARPFFLVIASAVAIDGRAVFYGTAALAWAKGHSTASSSGP